MTFGIDPRLADARQSETALAVARGTGRLLVGLGFAVAREVTLSSGRRCDLLALGQDGALVIVEIKSCLEDWRADRKWPDYRKHCDQLFFACPIEMDQSVFPQDAGLIVADAHGAEMIRDAPEHRVPAATRKSVMTRCGFAAAGKLHRLWDPGAIGLIE